MPITHSKPPFLQAHTSPLQPSAPLPSLPSLDAPDDAAALFSASLPLLRAPSLSGRDGEGPESLFSRYVEPLIPAIRRRVDFLTPGGGDDVDDNMQEVLVHLYLNIHRYDPAKALPATWINTVVTRKMEHINRPTTSAPAVIPIDTLLSTDVPSPPVHDYSPAVAAVLRRLTPQDRAIIIHYADGWPAREIADELHLSPAHVSQRIFRLKARLRTELPHPIIP